MIDHPVQWLTATKTCSSSSSALKAALPFVVPAIVALVANPTLTAKVRKNIVRYFSKKTTESGFGSDPQDFADAAIWASDQYQLLLLVVVTPLFGYFFSGSPVTKVIVATYVVSFVASVASYIYVLRKSSPADYIVGGSIGRVRFLKVVFSKVPWVRDISFVVFISTIVMLICGGGAAFASR